MPNLVYAFRKQSDTLERLKHNLPWLARLSESFPKKCCLKPNERLINGFATLPHRCMKQIDTILSNKSKESEFNSSGFEKKFI